MSGILRFLTCGSVDDGKSTLIGRILYDTHNVYEDQLATLENESKRIGNAGSSLDFSLLLDGLMAEREQGITIDVAYRYFTTASRKFIVADTPGHVQYTRNMATGASNCDAAVILIDARQGVLDQTRRHSLICALMGIRHVLFAVNKMDLADWDRTKYESIRVSCIRIADDLAAAGLPALDYHCVPISAVFGDNCLTRSSRTPWFEGQTVVAWLETINPENSHERLPFRMAVQYVIKPGISRDKWQNSALETLTPEEQRNYRAYAGRVFSGTLKTGSEITVLPSGVSSTVTGILHADTQVSEAKPGDSVALTLSSDIDISRGDCIAESAQRPESSDIFKARVVWMDEQPLFAGRRYTFRSQFGSVQCEIIRICDLTDLSEYKKLSADRLAKNDIGEIELKLLRPVPYDEYSQNRFTGSFILIDRMTNATSGCGMILHSMRRAQNVHWQNIEVGRDVRAQLMGQRPAILWFTGLSGVGKSTIANILEKKLHSLGRHTMLLDGDNVRHGLNKDLGFTEADRIENIRRIGEVARLMTDAGIIVLTAFISPYRSDRDLARAIAADGEFIEIFVDTPLETCEKRDPKGLYIKARNGEIPNFTGINSPYEPPIDPEIVLDAGSAHAEELSEKILRYLTERKIL
jgi:bifunctional enzyme CysN/CysC